MNPVSPISSNRSGNLSEPTDQKTAFQDAVAGLFYGQMIKSLRSGVGKPAYLHGGQGEDLFQAQMDQLIAERMARQNGDSLVQKLYERFLADHPETNQQPPSQLLSLSQAVKSAPIVEPAQDAFCARPTTSVSGITTGTGVIPALIRK